MIPTCNTSFTMKKFVISMLLISFGFAFSCLESKAQTSPAQMPALGITNPWTEKQVIAPAVLAAVLNNAKANKPVILNIGAVSDIKGAKHIGAVSSPENMKKLSAAVYTLPKNTAIVIYCGCCPFNKCPNIRPAFTALQKEGFTDVKVLDLPVSLEANWSSKGYN
jgi:hypothetical protein